MFQTKTCPVCGKTFQTGGAGGKSHCVRFCSQSCAGRNSHPYKTPDYFWSKVDKSGGDDACWEWTGCTGTSGYGFAMYHDVRTRAHRVAWGLANGPIPEGLRVCHACDNPRCCNPAHLFVGTQADNMADKVAKGRWGKPGVHLTSEQVLEIRAKLASGVTQLAIAQAYGATRQAISAIATRRNWGWLE